MRASSVYVYVALHCIVARFGVRMRPSDRNVIRTSLARSQLHDDDALLAIRFGACEARGLCACVRRCTCAYACLSKRHARYISTSLRDDEDVEDV